MTELVPTPNDCPLPRRRADFATFTEAVDYAARSAKGLNFHDARGQLERVYPYSELRSDALGMARRLAAAGIAIVDQLLLSAAMCLISAWLGHRLVLAERAADAAG